MNRALCSPRENPFRSACLESLEYRGATAEEVIDRFEARGRRGALVGVCGSGKTTFLRSLHGELERRGFTVEHWWLRSDVAPPSLREIMCRARRRSPQTILSIDGAEQLGAVSWRVTRALARSAAGLLVTTHSPGRLPTLLEHTTSLSQTLDLVGTLDPTAVKTEQSRARVAALFAERAGNVREVFQELYLDRAFGRS